jgi:hypothetical protein
MLKERLRGKRIRFTDEERALLARKAKAIGRKALLELETIVSPDTLNALAPPTGGGEVELQRASKLRTAWNYARNLAAHRPHGERESQLGIHAHSRRVGKSEP